MVFILAFLFRAFFSPRLVESARTQANKGIRGAMEGHADMLCNEARAVRNQEQITEFFAPITL